MSREEIEQVEKELDEVLEIVQMVGLDVENDRDGGEEAQKRVAVFAALGNDRIALADAITGMKQL